VDQSLLPFLLGVPARYQEGYQNNRKNGTGDDDRNYDRIHVIFFTNR
jgi:hypothetical protein